MREHLGAVEHELIVVDNASADGSAEMVRAEFPGARLIRNADNSGFGTANNQAMAVARGEWLLLLNSDAALVDDSVARLLARARDEPDLGVAHCRVTLADGRLQHTTYRFPSLRQALLEDLGLHKLLGRRRRAETLLGPFWEQDHERDVDWVAGVFMLVRRSVYEATGGFDERLFMYGEDLDWCARIAAAGWRIRYFPQARIVHHDHASAELLFGDGREALCLQRHNEFFCARHGRAASAAFVGVRLAGSALRAAWYASRGRMGGPRAQRLSRHGAVRQREVPHTARPGNGPPMTWSYYEDPRPDVQALIDPAGRRCLDVGCATGALGAALKQRGASHVAGIELHGEAADSARRRLDVIVEGSVLDCPLQFAPGEFDFIVFADVLEHLPDPDAALARCLPYLAADGRIVVSVPNMRFYLVLARLLVDRWEYAEHGVRDRTHLRIFTRRSLVRMIEAHGLVIERMERNFRLLDDQSHIGRLGAIATRVARATIAPCLFRDLMAYQYLVVVRRAPAP